jgi:hypothetical protein
VIHGRVERDELVLRPAGVVAQEGCDLVSGSRHLAHKEASDRICSYEVAGISKTTESGIQVIGDAAMLEAPDITAPFQKEVLRGGVAVKRQTDGAAGNDEASVQDPDLPDVIVRSDDESLGGAAEHLRDFLIWSIREVAVHVVARGGVDQQEVRRDLDGARKPIHKPAVFFAELHVRPMDRGELLRAPDGRSLGRAVVGDNTLVVAA